MNKIIAGIASAAITASVVGLATPAQASTQTGWKERKLAQTALVEVWRYGLDPYDRATICSGWRRGFTATILEQIVPAVMEGSGWRVGYNDARYITIRFFNSACF